MKTDVFIKIFSQKHSQEEMQLDIEEAFQMFRDFESRFSRFKEESELSILNRLEEGEISEEFSDILQKSQKFYRETRGIFDPSILPVLEKIGYKGIHSSEENVYERKFSDITVDISLRKVYKPKNLMLDFGGIGKGYIIDKVAQKLSKKYTDGIVDAGGDMRVFGGDRDQDLNYFLIDIEDSFHQTETLTTLILENCAVATSGINRRNWKYEGKMYHHIIDPEYETSAHSGLMQVTVIAEKAVEADVWAKTLFILGLEKGLAFAKEKNIQALFVSEDKQINRTPFFKNYEWKL